MTKHVHWTCDGCDKRLEEQPARVKLSIDGAGPNDRQGTYDLCGQCISRAESAMWPDWWARPDKVLQA